MPTSALHEPVIGWYAEHARDLPWRRPGTSAWGVLVSEVMLQQTPVARVQPVWSWWLRRWPRPAALAGQEPGEAVRAWGRLGYPRRALWLHASAAAIMDRHGGEVPRRYEQLRALPGVGGYTAAAVAAFAYGHRHPVADINVRRVLARVVSGSAAPPRTPTRAELRTLEALLPVAGNSAASWSVAVMELGALVCTARAPRCSSCPLAAGCAWRRAGYPAAPEAGRRPQRWAGTDRQARGRLLAVLRETTQPVSPADLEPAWPAAAQRDRAMAGLVADGLAEALPDGRYRLPVSRSSATR